MNQKWWLGGPLTCALVNVSAVSAQGPGLHRVMREKLATSQKMLEAVVTSDWIPLEAQSRALQALTNDPGWMVLKAPEYARHSAAFRDHRAGASRRRRQTGPGEDRRRPTWPSR